ncbi:MAG: metal dependent phosphohydrolase [Magnetococcales bacterium]|nr:metal dependent phosphohydrolase [Magnetococcales bacterium]HIJ85175.1 HD domain-containing protein [Magnetococcales bacterium]
MSRKVFRDAVHNMIILHRHDQGPDCAPVDWGDALLLDLIDTPELQRLRRIRQLGPAAKIYPSAEHSRFSHSLGTLHLAKRMMEQAMVGGVTRLLPVEILAIKVSALFHDVGHGPHSHAFEQILPNLPNHEAWGWRILSEPGTPLTLIGHHCQRLGLHLALFVTTLREIWQPSATSDRLSGRPFISSQLDADRMDYLLRDAHFTGVSYGRFDLEWLLHSLKVRPVDGRPRICIDLGKGPAALESYIFARDHMYRQVYDHKTVRAFETLLVHIFGLIDWIWTRENQPPPETPLALTTFLDPARRGEIPTTAAFLALDDTVLDYALGRWANFSPRTPMQGELRLRCRMFCHRQSIYRRLQWNMPANIKDQEQLSFGFTPASDLTGTVALEPWMGERGGTTDLIHDAELMEKVERFFRDHGETLIPTPQENGGVLEVPLRLLARVDRIHRSPYAHLQYDPLGADPVYVITQEGMVRPAEQVSPLIHFLGQNRRRLARIFVDPRVVGRVRDMAKDRLAAWLM